MLDESDESPAAKTPLNEKTSPTPSHENRSVEKVSEQHQVHGKADEEAATAPSANAHVPEARTITGFRWFLACIAIFSANFLYGLDTTIAADIQAAVAQTYNDISKLGWLGVGFTLGSVALILPLGKAYAIFDTKWMFIGCLTMFAAASALCGGAPTMNAIIVGRIWAGAGGAGMYLGYVS